MREILFQGKRSDGKWAFGSLLKVTYDGTTYNLIFADNFLFVFGQATAMEHAAVIPETVGQFTGLTDKNGKKIFEGDIVQCVRTHCDGNEMIGHITFRDCCFCVKEKKSINEPAMDLCSDFEIIGNIHDSPELLEVD